MEFKDYIVSVNDFPKKGIVFKDITPLIRNGNAYKEMILNLAKYGKEKKATVVVGPEARGFIFGCPVAYELNIGFSPIRKPGKLARKTINENYELEYGTNQLCLLEDAIKKGDNVLIVDDLLATGGTILASIHLIEKLGGNVCGICCPIEIEALKGRELLKGYDVYTVIKY